MLIGFREVIPRKCKEFFPTVPLKRFHCWMFKEVLCQPIASNQVVTLPSRAPTQLFSVCYLYVGTSEHASGSCWVGWGCGVHFGGESSHYSEQCESHTPLVLLFPFPSCRKYLRNKLAFGQQLLPENHKCKGELRPRQAVLQVQRSFAGFSHHPEKGGVCSEGAAEDAVFGECFSFMSSE